jgi:hypothetical protein
MEDFPLIEEHHRDMQSLEHLMHGRQRSILGKPPE